MITADMKNNSTITSLLEVVLITYNRLEPLSNTLEKIFADYSPIKNCRITILDNCSTDGTSELCNKYSETFPNVIHIRHHKNIGGNANICRAYEIAQKKYVWCLADDDDIDWSSWSEIEKAIFDDYDCVFTTLVNLKRSRGIGGMLMESTFCPACIYKISNITSDVLQGMYANIHNFLPHLTIAISIIRCGGRFYIPNNQIIFQPPKLEDIPEFSTANNTRGSCASYSRLTEDKIWEVGFINMISLLNEDMQREVYAELSTIYNSRQDYILYIINYFVAVNCSSRNLFDIYKYLTPEYREIFLSTIFKYFQMHKIEKCPLSIEEWNLLFIDQVAKIKTGRVRSIIKKTIRKIMFFLLKHTQ